MGRIQRIAIASLDPERQAAFYKAVFGFEEVKRIDNPRATGVVLTDGAINISVLKFHQDQIGFRLKFMEALQHRAEQGGLQPVVILRLGIAEDLPLHDHLRTHIALRLQQHRVHVDTQGNTGRPRLQRLGPPDLAAIGGDRGIVRHVLWLEGPHAKPALRERARKASDDQRLADIGAGALEHDRRLGHAS